MSAHLAERLRCRSCGIGSPDVGFTYDGDLLCDDCEAAMAGHLARLRMARTRRRVVAIPHRGSPEVNRAIRAAFARALR